MDSNKTKLSRLAMALESLERFGQKIPIKPSLTLYCGQLMQIIAYPANT